MTLSEALGIAYETNPDLAAAQAGLRAADEQVAQANGAWRPTISIGATYGVEKYYLYSVQINGFGVITSHPLGTLAGAPSGDPASTTISESITDHPLNGQATISQPLFAAAARSPRSAAPRPWCVRAGRS